MFRSISRARSSPAGRRGAISGNQILRLLPKPAVDALIPLFERVELRRGESIFEPGDDVAHILFPLDTTVVALVLPMRSGDFVEAATIGREGVLGGNTTAKTVFTGAVARIPGPVLRMSLKHLEDAKTASPKLQDLMARYTDCLTAQVLQSVGCATVHTLEQRCARWLLLMQDRLQKPDLPLTQEMLAEMFGVTRTYVTRIVKRLQARGAISSRRGVITIAHRTLLEELSCECYGLVRAHFHRVQPGLYPDMEL